MHRRGLRIQADLVVVAASIPEATNRRFYAPGQIELRDGRIVEVTGEVSQRPDVRLEGYALLPGLVNPHTHLEFSDLTAPLPRGKHFPDWIASVLAARRERGPEPEAALSRTLATGLRQSRVVGVAALVDIVTRPWSPELLDAELAMDSAWQHLPADLKDQLPRDAWQLLQQHGRSADSAPAVIACLEQLGLSQERTEPVVQWRDAVLKTRAERLPKRLLSIGLSPHAPYSTREPLWRETFAMAADQQRLVAMHIAESQAERQWLDSGTGPFAELFQKLGVSVSTPSQFLIPELLHGLSQAPHGLLIHGNYLAASEIDELGKYRERVSVVYCPRTHAHFGHAPYPLEAYARRGIRVVLGTDSRSSNPDLNLWQEARAALSKHESLRPSAALAAISDSAAAAVGLGDRFGSLLPGHIAAINAVSLAQQPMRDDFEELVAGWFDSVDHPVVLT